MKTFFIILLSFFVTVSCDDNNTNNNSSENKVSASINGNYFKADNINCEVMLGPARKVLRIYGESGELAVELLLRFEPMDTIKTGTYNLSTNGEYTAVYHHVGVSDTASEGYVKLDKFIDGQTPATKGSFSFLRKDSSNVIFNVSNGTFETVK